MLANVNCALRSPLQFGALTHLQLVVKSAKLTWGLDEFIRRRDLDSA